MNTMVMNIGRNDVYLFFGEKIKFMVPFMRCEEWR